MGHCEMLLAVAGLEEQQIKQKTQVLASGDWSSFTVPEQLAFRFAAQMTAEPSTVTAADTQLLIDTFGTERALDIIWYVAWCNYMTRIADAFQLPLETTNVFAELQQTRSAPASPAKK